MNRPGRSQQLDPSGDLFWKKYGFSKRPQNWQMLFRVVQFYKDNDYEKEELELDEFEWDYDEQEEWDDCDDSDYEYETEFDYDKQNARDDPSNPNNDEYWQLRGFTKRPPDYRELFKRELCRSYRAMRKNNKWWKFGKNVH